MTFYRLKAHMPPGPPMYLGKVAGEWRGVEDRREAERFLTRPQAIGVLAMLGGTWSARGRIVKITTRRKDGG